jgi:NAD(P)H-quinone oxidoreductase subunit 5
LHDYHVLENALDGHLPKSIPMGSRLIPARFKQRFYVIALERGHLDSLLDRFVARPFWVCFQRFDRLERKWTDLLSGEKGRESDRTPTHNETIDELRF